MFLQHSVSHFKRRALASLPPCKRRCVPINGSYVVGCASSSTNVTTPIDLCVVAYVLVNTSYVIRCASISTNAASRNAAAKLCSDDATFVACCT